MNTIFAAYTALLDGSPVPASIGISLLVFLVKQGEDLFDGGMLCLSDDLRPIALGNVCLKLICGLLAGPLTESIANAIHRSQRGGFKGGQIRSPQLQPLANKDWLAG